MSLDVVNFELVAVVLLAVSFAACVLLFLVLGYVLGMKSGAHMVTVPVTRGSAAVSAAIQGVIGRYSQHDQERRAQKHDLAAELEARRREAVGLAA